MSKKFIFSLLLLFFSSVPFYNFPISIPIKTIAGTMLKGTGSFIGNILTGACFATGAMGATIGITQYLKAQEKEQSAQQTNDTSGNVNSLDSIKIIEIQHPTEKLLWDPHSPATTITNGFIDLVFLALALKLMHILSNPSLMNNNNNNKFPQYQSGTVKENFNNVAGNHEAKEELKDIVDYLQNPTKFQKLGAKVPRGVLLTGKPGTGKTLLARAIAGEANCSFIACSGSEFVDKYVGAGSSRIRTLFETARTQSPCIIFIDEIDALAKKRSSSSEGGDSEYNQTVNQLLTEMDGFNKHDKPIIIIGATNHINNLDDAILRPGRFDRIVNVSLPDITSREAILKVHLANITYDPNLDIHKIAQTTPGFSGADLENLVNEAAIIATKKNLDSVTINEFEEAKDKVTLGAKHTTLKMTIHEKKYTAYHEAGHALVLLLSPQQNNALNKITILPQGQALGITHYLPEQELHSFNKEQLLAQINIALGGRAAEELMFNEIATGASSDFEHASKLARAMICKYGMTNILGKQVLLTNQIYSQETLKKIDDGVTKILETQYQEVMNLLTTHKEKLIKLAEKLLQKETLYADEVYQLLNITPRKTFKIA